MKTLTKQRVTTKSEKTKEDQKEFAESLVQYSAVPTFVLDSSHRVTYFGLVEQLIYAKSGTYRLNAGQAVTPGVTSNGYRVGNGIWQNSTSNITSITIIPDSGNIAAGSRIVLRRLL